MIITNEQISTAIQKTPDVIRASLKDVEAFMKDSHKQILFSVHEGMNTVSERVRLDFEGITRLTAVFSYLKFAFQKSINSWVIPFKGIWNTALESKVLWML